MTRPTLFIDDSLISKAAQLIASVAHAESVINQSTVPPLPRIHTSSGDIHELPLLLLHLTSTTPLALSTPAQQTELDTWIGLFQSVASTSLTANVLTYLNDALQSRTFLLSTHLTSADLLFLAALHPAVSAWEQSERAQYVHVMRWFDHVQHHQRLLPIVPYTPPSSGLLHMDLFPPPPPPPTKAPATPTPSTASASAAPAKPGLVSSVVSAVTSVISSSPNPPKLSSAPAVSPDSLPQVTRLDLRVATVLTAVAHPTEARMATLTVDVGEAAPRQLVAGIADVVSLPTLIGRTVLCMCNLKAGDIKGVESNGRILVATEAGAGEGGKKEVVFVEGATVRGGERVRVVEGVEPDAVLAPKNLHRILKGLKTDAEGYVVFEQFPIATSAGRVQTAIKDGMVA